MTETILIDIDSGVASAGFAGDDAPRVKMSTVIDGHDALEQGYVKDWGRFATLLSNIFAEIRVESAGNRVFITETLLNPEAKREELTKLLFESFGVDGMLVFPRSVLALISQERLNGIVVDIGEDASYVVPAYKGYPIKHAILKFNLAERDLDTNMQKLLADRGISVDLKTAGELVDSLCYVAQDYEQTLASGGQGEASHAGTTLGNERFQVPEAFFQPALIGVETPGVHEITHRSLMACNLDYRKELYGSIVLTGRGSMLSGMAERLAKEVTALAPRNVTINVSAAPDRDASAWRGGSMLAYSSNLESTWITRAEYEETGPEIVNRKNVW